MPRFTADETRALLGAITRDRSHAPRQDVEHLQRAAGKLRSSQHDRTIRARTAAKRSEQLHGTEQTPGADA